MQDAIKAHKSVPVTYHVDIELREAKLSRATHRGAPDFFKMLTNEIAHENFT